MTLPPLKLKSISGLGKVERPFPVSWASLALCDLSKPAKTWGDFRCTLGSEYDGGLASSQGSSRYDVSRSPLRAAQKDSKQSVDSSRDHGMPALASVLPLDFHDRQRRAVSFFCT